ncbi:MAG: heavy metal-binding domain-containing protein [Pseudomonadota bacterium]|nr:heavy metal-binding domain-containing protein [Pseudomonadota bacterium]
MIITTTPSIEGKCITDYLAIVSGQAIMGADLIRDILENVHEIVGGSSGAYEEALKKARKIALQEVADEARRFGADAVVGLDINYEVLGAAGAMLMVSANGTAVRIEDNDPKHLLLT